MANHINVMAPLVVGDPANLDSEVSRAAWSKFEDELKQARALGVTGVSTDIWWGMIEPSEGEFKWAYYDRLSDCIIRAGLKWVPIISLHQCGGNIGDDVFVPIPDWVWAKVAEMDGSDNADSVKFVSEQGNASREYVSFWATELVLDNYEAVMRAFAEHFKGKAAHIAEVNVSLGPSGELRYPSYNSHDRGTDYPTRGALQCYSSRARRAFRNAVYGKYGSKEAIEKAWGRKVTAKAPVAPPKDAAGYFARNEHSGTQFGRDLHDFYADTLIAHGRTMIGLAMKVFSASGSAFSGIDLGFKIPGIHWRIGKLEGDNVVLGDRMAELAAGLIRTTGDDWNTNEAGRGYRPLVSMFGEFAGKPSRVVLHFTCLEMPDSDGKPEVKSLAHQLVLWVGNEAVRAKVALKGENALSWNLPARRSWELMRSVLAAPVGSGPYEGLTLLRLADCLASDIARAELEATTKAAKPQEPKAA